MKIAEYDNDALLELLFSSIGNYDAEEAARILKEIKRRMSFIPRCSKCGIARPAPVGGLCSACASSGLDIFL